MNNKLVALFHVGEFIIVLSSGVLVVLSHTFESRVLLLPVFLLGITYALLFRAVRSLVPESSRGVHRSNSIMITLSALAALYRPGALVLGILLLFISLCILLRIFLRPGGRPVKKNLSWNPAHNF